MFGNNGGNLVGRTDFIGWGDVPEGFRQSIADVAFWVYSYGTPVAWRHADGCWYMPPVRYSWTTSGHQRRVADAIYYDFKVKTSLMLGHGRTGRYGAREGW